MEDLLKICPETGESFTCGGGTGSCWCKDIPIVQLEPSETCLGPMALKNKAMEQGLIEYTNCPICDISFHKGFKTGSKCPGCLNILESPLKYINIKWKEAEQAKTLP